MVALLLIERGHDSWNCRRRSQQLLTYYQAGIQPRATKHTTSHYYLPLIAFVTDAIASVPCIIAHLLHYTVLLLCTFPIFFFPMALDGIKEKLKKLESKIIHPSKHNRDQDTTKSTSQPSSRDGDRRVGSSHGSPRDQQHSGGTVAQSRGRKRLQTLTIFHSDSANVQPPSRYCCQWQQ